MSSYVNSATRRQIARFYLKRRGPNIVVIVKGNPERLEDMTLNDDDLTVQAAWLTFRPWKLMWVGYPVVEIVDAQDASELCRKIRRVLRTKGGECGNFRLHPDWARRFGERHSHCVVEIEPYTPDASAVVVRTWHLTEPSFLRRIARRAIPGILATAIFFIAFFGFQWMGVDPAGALAPALLLALTTFGLIRTFEAVVEHAAHPPHHRSSSHTTASANEHSQHHSSAQFVDGAVDNDIDNGSSSVTATSSVAHSSSADIGEQ
jgi:hypothetical protein